MNEKNQEKKKDGLAKRIFRSIGLGILTLIILPALVFEVSLKIVILLVIILAAFTALPKPARKWFWLSVGAVVIALTIWVFLPEDNEGWRPYTFDEELAAFEDKYAIPDEKNAATIYDALLRDNDPNIYYPDFLGKNADKFTRSEPWSSLDYPKPAKWLEGHQNTISELMKAGRKEKCYFPVSANFWDLGEHAERLAPMRRWVFMLLYAGNNYIAESRIDAGIEKYLCLIRMADQLYQQPVMIYHILARSIENWSLSVLNRFVVENQPTNEQLQRISNSIKSPENNWSTYFGKALEYDKLFAANNFCNLAYEVNQKGTVRLCRDPEAAYTAAVSNDIPSITYSRRKLNKAKTILNWFAYPSSPQKAAEIIDASFNKYETMAEPDFDWTKEPPQQPFSFFTVSNLHRSQFSFKYYTRFTANILSRSYYGLHDEYLRIVTLRRGLRLLVAIKQYHNEHGTWPDSLEAIKSAAPAEAFIDPVTGNQLEYENHGERFSLYGEATNIWPG